jgi:DNA-directed RNA polymerase subunit F
MIFDRQPLNLNETQEILEKISDSDKKEETKIYLKKFLKTKPEKAKKIKEELEKADLLKLKGEHIVKIIDLIPESASELNKIFTDLSLNENETNKILEIVKNSK